MLGPEHDDSNGRAELLKRLQATHALGALEGAQFMLGARLCVLRGVTREAADTAIGELSWLGARAAAEPHREDDGGMQSLDEVADAGPESNWSALPGGAGPMLAALDEGDAEASAAPPAVPASLASATPAVAKPAPPPPAASVAASPVMAPPTADDERFRPRDDAGVAVDIQMEAPPVLPPIRDVGPIDHRAPAADGEDEPPPAGTDAPAPVRGRLFDGKLRDNPGARIGVGLVLALGLGYVIAQPYARRAARHVAEIRAEADQERYRPVPEARARTAELDRQAEDASSSGAFGIGVIWLGAAAASFAGWWRAT